ncbi:hypothetical protein BS78_05G021800 [Paspalum vaginatum]|nr:hypothetical protein BS78_05G021800 [Paspalum vaginatum]
MMFYDASFLLLYMVAYTNSQGKKENYYVNPSMRRFLFSNRDSINNDIMLLENQLPWPVLQALMGLVSEEDKKREYLFTAVGKFIAGIGNEFKVSVDFHTECYVWDDEKNPPPHLLALLRRHMTERQQGPERLNKPLPLLSNCFKFDKEKTMAPNDETPQTKSDNQQEKNYKFTLMPTVSPMELEEIGIKLKGSQTATFSDMDFVPGRLWSELSLVPLSLSNTRASCLVNMVAFELCTASRFGDGHDRTAVCSYLALLAMLMVREEDVRTLRSKGLLHGHQSDNQVLTFFKTVAMHLPDTVSRFAIVMENIDEYRCRRRVWISLYKWLYNHYASILQVASILKVAALLGTLITIYTAVRSLHKQG